MRSFTDSRDERTLDEIWINQHTPVFTQGQSGRQENVVEPRDIPVVHADRGGQVTYHGPGQKVVYFVLNLKERGKDIRKLIRYIEKCIIQILQEYKIKSFNDKKNIGIWVNVNGAEKKVAAIGIRVKRWIAFHGFSINISNNLEVYKNIVPCGIYNFSIFF